MDLNCHEYLGLFDKMRNNTDNHANLGQQY